jgi:hypothetical protein
MKVVGNEDSSTGLKKPAREKARDEKAKSSNASSPLRQVRMRYAHLRPAAPTTRRLNPTPLNMKMSTREWTEKMEEDMAREANEFLLINLPPPNQDPTRPSVTSPEKGRAAGCHSTATPRHPHETNLQPSLFGGMNGGIGLEMSVRKNRDLTREIDSEATAGDVTNLARPTGDRTRVVEAMEGHARTTEASRPIHVLEVAQLGHHLDTTTSTQGTRQISTGTAEGVNSPMTGTTRVPITGTINPAPHATYYTNDLTNDLTNFSTDFCPMDTTDITPEMEDFVMKELNKMFPPDLPLPDLCMTKRRSQEIRPPFSPVSPAAFDTPPEKRELVRIDASRPCAFPVSALAGPTTRMTTVATDTVARATANAVRRITAGPIERSSVLYAAASPDTPLVIGTPPIPLGVPRHATCTAVAEVAVRGSAKKLVVHKKRLDSDKLTEASRQRLQLNQEENVTIFTIFAYDY